MAQLSLRRRLANRVYYGWVIAVACLLVALVTFGTSYSFGVFFERMLADFTSSRARLASVFGIQTLVLYLGAIAAGGVVDRYGPRRTLPVGGAALVLGLLGTSRADSFLDLVVAYGLVTALGLSILYVVGYATVPQWFLRRRGTANGLASSGLGVGLVVVPPAASSLITLVGWRQAFVLLAVFVGVVVAVATLLFADEPSDVGADSCHEFPDGENDTGTTDTDLPWLTRVRSLLANPMFLLVVLGYICVFSTMYALFAHVVAYATDLGFTQRTGALAIGVVGVTTTVTRLGVGPLSDRLGRLRLFPASGALMSLALPALVVVPMVVGPPSASPVVLFAVVAVFGVGYGGLGALLSPFVADLFGSEDLNTVYGLVSISFGVSGLLAPPLAGLVYERVGQYDPAFLGLGVVGLAGAAMLRVAARRHG